MKYHTDNTRIVERIDISSPEEVIKESPITDEISSLVYGTRNEIANVLHGRDNRIIVVVGPCSIHNKDSALEYAHKLKAERDRLSDMNWPRNPKLWEHLMTVIDSVEEIYLTGGEPTLALEQYKLFDKCIELDKAKDIILKYNTNLTNIPPKMIEYWKHFKKIKINASIDGYDQLNRYIRYPTNWKSVNKNLSAFAEMEKQGKMRVQVHSTVQIYNVLDINELFEYTMQFGYFPYLNILNHPDYLNVRVLPDNLKQLAAKRLQPWIKHDKVEGLINYMMAEDWTKHNKKFVEYTESLDKSRNQSLIDVAPELKEIL